MTEQTPHNLLHVSATRVSSPEDATQLPPLPEASQANQSAPLRDYESLALISQEMNKDHRYLADKRAQSQSSNSFYQMGGGALGGASVLAYLFDKNKRFSNDIENTYRNVQAVFEKHDKPYQAIRDIQKISYSETDAFKSQMKEKAEILLKHFCESENIDVTQEAAEKIAEKITTNVKHSNIGNNLGEEISNNPKIKPFIHNVRAALKYIDVAQNKGGQDLSIDQARAHNNQLSEMFDNEIKPLLQEKHIGLKGDALDKAENHFLKNESLSGIKSILRKDIGRTLDKVPAQALLSAGAIIASATIGSLAYSFVHSKDKQDIKNTEKKIDALGDAFELYNTPNTTVDSSSDISLEKLVNGAEHSTPSRSTP